MFDLYKSLFVTWRSPNTRGIYPVGRLNFDPVDSVYTFNYVEGAVRAEKVGFLPFPEFPNLSRTYRSKALFPLFSNRVMPRSRPGYAEFLKSLGLFDDAHPEMAILARTGGRRATDQIELFPLPEQSGVPGCYITYFLLRSVRYMPQPATDERIRLLTLGEELLLEQDPANPVDPNAVIVTTRDGFQLGYLPAYLTSDLKLLNTECDSIRVFVERVNHSAEPHHRILCKVVSCWPNGFEPFRSDELQSYQTPVYV